MKKKNVLFISVIVIVSGLFLLLFLDFAALHDIKKEYISKNMFEFLGVQIPKEIPHWTENKGEWNYLNASVVSRFVGYSAIVALIVYLFKIKD